jgi:hypothetical protein
MEKKRLRFLTDLNLSVEVLRENKHAVVRVT